LNAVKPRRKTARDLVVEAVRAQIISGELEPGAKLNVVDTAQGLDVSQTPAREAFQLLAAEGLVRLSPYRGATVAPLSADEYQEIFLMRVGLEGLAGRLGAERIEDADVREMKARLDEMNVANRVGDINAFLDADRSFHQIHYLASGRPRLWERIISLRHSAERYTRAAYELPIGGMKDTLKSHKAIWTAVRAHDGNEAERILREDLQSTYESMSRHLREDPVFQP
jgi:GntR family transcriptional regulator, rspAB operon transcriptional repressor